MVGDQRAEQSKLLRIIILFAFIGVFENMQNISLSITEKGLF